ncbi:MAG: WD40 repeat domain-containing protein [Anaerolineales bacterium]|nr:WD40 repeat domain-containing protein [Anaerolineales bacterium]
MSDENKNRVQADNNSIAIGSISAGGNIGDVRIQTGYTSEQVAVLITQIRSTFQAKPFDGRCPYKGLDVFEEEDAELFFGREKLVDDLVSRVKDSRTVFVTGPSGSGKSSLVRAGLIHALKQGAIKGSDRWLYATMKPGRDPIGELGRVVSSLASSTNPEDEIRAKAMKDATIFARWCEIALKEGRDKRLVLFIDQFEEVFTQISNEEERVAFLNLLTHAATIENGRVIILFSMRSDFVSNCATYPQLNALLNKQFVQIGAMQPEELVSAIAQPALRVGLRIDPDLIAQIINEMKGEPGALPLMQFALKDLFDSQQEKSGVPALILNDYLQRGGIHKALERHADDSFSKLSKNEQELARSIFSGLIEIGRGTQDTKRTALFDELVPANTNVEDVETIVQKLADARLITTDEAAGKDTVTISHEKLIDAWPWLKKLVNENRDVIALQNEITSDAKEWGERKRDASYLYVGARLANVDEQLKANKLALSGLIFEYIRASQAQQRRGQYRLIGGISTIFILLIITIFIFANLTRKAQEQANLAHAGELAAQSVAFRDSQLDLSLLFSIEANRVADIPRTTNILLDGALARPELSQYLHGTSVAYSPDGKMLAFSDTYGNILLWDVTIKKIIGLPFKGHTEKVWSIVFSPDNKTLASVDTENNIFLWNLTTHQALRSPIVEDTDRISTIVFSPDSKTLLSGTWEDTIKFWDVETGQAIGPILFAHTDGVVSLAFSFDGKILASGGWQNIVLWDVSTRQPIGQPLIGHSEPINSLAFSPDGKMLASGGDDNIIILWNLETSQAIGQPLRAHIGVVYSVAFSQDGRTLASGSSDKTIILWDMETRQPIGQPLIGHTSDVFHVDFSPDGNTVVSNGADDTIILWDRTKLPEIGQRFTKLIGSVNSVAFSPDGTLLASASCATETEYYECVQGEILLWDLGTAKVVGLPFTEHTGPIDSMSFSPDGNVIASTSCKEAIETSIKNYHRCVLGEIILWDVKTRQAIGQPIIAHLGSIYSVAFSPDGKLLASASCGEGIEDTVNNYYNCIRGEVILWDLETRQPIGKPLTTNSGPIDSVAFSPDGKILASGNGDFTIILWDMGTLQPIGQPLRGHTGSVSMVIFSTDGKMLASSATDGTIILWDTITGQPIGLPLSGYDAGFSANSITISPDNKILASGSWNKTILLWNVETHEIIGLPLQGHSNSVNSVAFSPDGKTLASGSTDKTVILWNLDPQFWLETNCQRTGRNFTRAEWNLYFPTEEYRKTCEQWPLEPEATASPTP